MSALPKLIFRFKAILFKSHQGYGQAYSKIDTRSRLAKAVLKKENKVGRIILPAIQAYQIRVWEAKPCCIDRRIETKINRIIKRT